MTRPATLPRLILILLSVTFASCAQVQSLSSLDSSWTLSNLWNQDKDAEAAERERLRKLIEADIQTRDNRNQFLTGLSDREIESVKKEAWREYGRFWRGVATRSRYVRQPLIETLDQLGAPRELQMVPVVESSYNPYVESSVGATGLWQLMPETAADMRVKSDRYFDGRRDIRRSTRGAAKYLTKQYRRFGNWQMALAAYHLGPSAVQRRLNRRPWQPEDGLRKMPLPPITKTYIRHIIGLIALHEEETIRFPHPFPTKTIKLQTPVDLAHLHELAELPKDQIFRFNPQLKFGQYYDGKPQTIHLRIAKVRLKSLQPHIAEPREHLTIKVAKGESLESISLRFRTSTYALLKNNPKASMFPKAGTRLRIPVKLMKRIDAKGNPLVTGYGADTVEVALN